MVLMTIHPITEGLALVVAAGLKYRDNSDPMALREDLLHGETGSVGLHKLMGGIIHCIVRNTLAIIFLHTETFHYTCTS